LDPPRSALFPSTTLFRSGVFEGFVAHRWPYFLAHVVVFVLPSLWGVIYFACREGAELSPGDGLGLGAPPTGSEDASQGPTVSGRDRKSTRLNSSHVKISY